MRSVPQTLLPSVCSLPGRGTVQHDARRGKGKIVDSSVQAEFLALEPDRAPPGRPDPPLLSRSLGVLREIGSHHKFRGYPSPGRSLKGPIASGITASTSPNNPDAGARSRGLSLGAPSRRLDSRDIRFPHYRSDLDLLPWMFRAECRDDRLARLPQMEASRDIVIRCSQAGTIPHGRLILVRFVEAVHRQ